MMSWNPALNPTLNLQRWSWATACRRCRSCGDDRLSPTLPLFTRHPALQVYLMLCRMQAQQTIRDLSG